MHASEVKGMLAVSLFIEESRDEPKRPLLGSLVAAIIENKLTSGLYNVTWETLRGRLAGT